ncbi:glycosyltransferase family 4 protein [Micromonospora thermarum]|uniref:Glycosyltransferase family 4 protein n=1 Tax=Micromonospora thermarum TaxID=2720024 RepID=A0ABX0YZY7_9ACTN|nr:glycosyltransferase family 4 protein [Micromonospora thermarum]NJP30808.1 glycosyltransferase family 4 protein [Micromonospora thermarum]
MKILFVDHTGRPGGAELGLKRYFEQPSKYERELLLFQGGALDGWAEAAGVPVSVLGWNGHNRSVTLVLAMLRAWWVFLRSRSDVVIANSLNAAILTAFLPKRRRQFIYYLREDLSPEWLSGRKRSLVVRWILPRFDGFLANSQWTASTIPQQLSQKPMRVVYTMSGISDSSLAARRAARGGALRILSLSRLTHWKGVHVLLQALAVLRDRGLGGRVSVTVAGDDLFEDAGRYVAELRTLAAGLGNDVTFVGHVDDVDHLLASHDVLVSGSLNAEPFGQVVVQGMSAGLVVIATEMGGPQEVIDSGTTGILVPPGDPDALARAIESVLLDPSLSETIGNAAVPAGLRYADAPMAALLESSIHDLVDGSGSSV